MNDNNQNTNSHGLHSHTETAPIQEPKPSVGRIVHFVRYMQKACNAAIITQVINDNEVMLTYFDPSAATPMPTRASKEGSKAAENSMTGSWHWPERI